MLQNKKTALITGGLIGAAVLLFVFSGNDNVIGTYGVNKTVGWAWEITTLLPFIVLGGIIIFYAAVYSFLSTVGVKFNNLLIILHSMTILFILLLYFTNMFKGEVTFYIVFSCLIFSLLLFVANIILSLTKYFRAKRNIAYKK